MEDHELDALLASIEQPSAAPEPEPEGKTVTATVNAPVPAFEQPTPAPVVAEQPEPEPVAEEGSWSGGNEPASINGLRTFVDPAEVSKDVNFELHNLDNAIREHAGKYVYYAHRAALARRQFDECKSLGEVVVAKLNHLHREKMAEEGKKVTEAQVDAAVKMDPRWLELQKKIIDARAIYDFANSACDAFVQRRDMLVQVSVDRRHEAQGELRIRSAQAIAADAQRSAMSAMLGGAKTSQVSHA
jgi:hypothetical protein